MSHSLESSVSDLACNRQLVESFFCSSQMQMRISVRYEPADVLFAVIVRIFEYVLEQVEN